MDLTIQEVLRKAREMGASDVHFNVGIPPVFRLNGKLIKSDYPLLDAEGVHKIIYSILSDKQKEMFEKDRQLDFRCV